MTINPSCSELVTHLDITKLEEIKEALKEIVRVTGYKVGFVETRHEMSDTPLDMNNRTIRVFNTYEVSIDEITKRGDRVGLPEDKIPNEEWGKSVWTAWKGDNIIPLDLYNDKTGIYLNIRIGDGYSNNHGLTICCTQHCCSSEFPVFKEIIDHFNSDYEAYDGGSTTDFENWLNGEKE